MCADTLDFYAEHGEPLDVDNDTSGWPILLLIVIGVPMIIAGIVCGVLYSQMKTARLKTEANDYIGAGLKLRVQVDNYTHTDRVQVYDPPHEESSSSGGSSVDSDGFGGSSGGSGVHTSSGGSTPAVKFMSACSSTGHSIPPVRHTAQANSQPRAVA